MINPLNTISFLPSLENIKRECQSLALLDAIIMPEWEYRYFSFNNNWDCSKGEAMASMRDGLGGGCFIHFTKDGVVGKIFGEERLSNIISCLDMIPDSFSSFKTEPAFNVMETTLFFWRLNEDTCWKSFPEKLDVIPFLGLFTGNAKDYHIWAEKYYDRSIDFTSLENVYNTLKVKTKELELLNPDLEMDDLAEDLAEILL